MGFQIFGHLSTCRKGQGGRSPVPGFDPTGVRTVHRNNPTFLCPNSSVNVETGLRLLADVGRPYWGQLPRRDPGTPLGPGQDEESHYQEVEAPDGGAHPRQLPRYPTKCCLLSYWIWRLCCLNPFF